MNEVMSGIMPDEEGIEPVELPEDYEEEGWETDDDAGIDDDDPELNAEI